jgi:hypothetical protein
VKMWECFGGPAAFSSQAPGEDIFTGLVSRLRRAMAL